MKKIIILSIALMFTSACIFGQRTMVTMVDVEKPCTKRGMFAPYFGLGTGSIKISDEKATGFTGYGGFRWTRMFTPNIGLDWKILEGYMRNLNGDVFNSDGYGFSSLIGVRGQSPIFGNCMSGYGVVRLGYGFDETDIWIKNSDFDYGSGTSVMGFEIELGLNLTPWFYIGYALQSKGGGARKFDCRDLKNEPITFDKVGIRSHTVTLGFNLGKRRHL